MSNPIARQSSKYKRILKDLVSTGGFNLEGKQYSIISFPSAPDGFEISCRPMEIAITRKTGEE